MNPPLTASRPTSSAVPPARAIRRRGFPFGSALMLGIALWLAQITPVSHAQSSSASFQIPRQSIDAGATRATSATHDIHGTLGQPEVGPAMSSATYALQGGFHRAAPALPDPLFADGFEPPRSGALTAY